MKKLLIFIVSLFFSCQKDDEIKLTAYKDKYFTEYYGNFYPTKYGGLNYYISDEGMIASPGVFKLSTLESTYGNNQGVDPTKNESRFYNPVE